MKIYISLPITGKDIEAVEASLLFAKGVIEQKGYTPISPLDQDITQSYATLMGNDIRMLLLSDAVVFLDGWEQSRGCQLEHCTALIYNKQRYYDLVNIPPKQLSDEKQD